MNRATWLQGRRMQKFRDVLSRWEAGELSMMDGGESPGMSERQFRRYRDRFVEDGEEGLRDRRFGKRSAKRVPAAEQYWVLALYREAYQGWNVKHFHEHLVRDHGFRWGYTWVKTQLHTAGLVERAKRRGAHRRKRERKPCEGMMLHQDGSREVWSATQPMLDLIATMDDATSKVYSAVLVEEEGTGSTFQTLLEVFTVHGLPSSLYTDRGSHYFCLLWRICGSGRGPFVRFNPAGWILLLRLWACGQRACVVQVKRHVHSPIAQRVVAWWAMRKR